MINENELPEDWRLISLKNLAVEKGGLRRGPFGSAIKKSFFVTEGYKVYEQSNAINDDPYRGNYYLDEKKYNELISFKVEPGDFIVSCSGTLGRILEIPPDAKPGVINQALLRIRLKKELINSDYFIAYFRSAFFQNSIFISSQGSAMNNLVGIKEFKEIKLIVPPIKEQLQTINNIETYLSVCDKLKDTMEYGIKQLEVLRQCVLKKAFEGRLKA